jgi:alcohol dehydrogenase
MFQFKLGTQVIAGRNAISQLGENAGKFGNKILVITDRGIVKTGLLKIVTDLLDTACLHYAVYNDVTSNPTVKNVEEAGEACRQNNCDLLIAVGGGSAIDCAKGAAVVALNGGDIYDYNVAAGRTFEKALPVIAIPTTCGTGSEVSYGTVITIPEECSKFVVVSQALFPVQAYLDPQMVEKLPPYLVAATGIDALTHAIESYISTGANSMSDSFDLQSIRLIGKYLKPAYAGDTEARFQMQCASSLAAMGFSQAGLGLVHAMAVTMGGKYNMHHGIANAVLLPYVMGYNRVANEPKYADIAIALGQNTASLSLRDSALLAVEAVKNLNRDVCIPQNLHELGVQIEDIPELSEKASVHSDGLPNPRKYTKYEIEVLFREAF